MTTSPTGPFSVQVVVDCSEPHVLADWWAETLEWEVEPQDEAFIRSMVEQGLASEDDTTTHNGSLVFASGCAIGPGGAGGGPGQPRILFQQVPEAKTVKNRMHLDVRPGPPGTVDLDALRERLVEHGAVEVGRGQQGPHTWVTFADPEGNEFCV